MNKPIMTVLAALFAAQSAFAADEAKPAAASKAPSEKQMMQREHMKTCNKEASDQKLKGAERKKFMSGCLKADAAPAMPAQPAMPAMPAAKK